jgi:microcystin-dependent protein
MATPFLAEIRVFSFNFAPRGWAMCNGQFLPINQNQALFSLLGTSYGGNGVTTFALPDLRARVPVHAGAGYTEGQAGGAAAVTLNTAAMPQHVHTLRAANSDATTTADLNNMVAGAREQAFKAPEQLAAMAPNALANAGGSQAHTNMQPYLVLNFCMALQGIFPSRN